jgi:hypothetical protein
MPPVKLKPKTLQKAVPEELKALPEQETDVKPSPMTTAVRAMLGQKTKAKPVGTGPLPSIATAAAATSTKSKARTSASVPVPASVPVAKEDQSPAEEVREAAEEIEEIEEASAIDRSLPPAEDELGEISLSEDRREMAELIRKEESDEPYDLPATPYVPETRRGFSKFIKETYNSYMLEAAKNAIPTPSGEKYPYQKFVREYMRQASPYRGILVYHGLGSGKTCTSIAASEALYSTSNKKIIVMTPFSLRKNFLKEVSKCGFRHFRLQNHWEQLDKSDPDARLFATEVLGISESHLRSASAIWVPDFRKTESNYASLEADQQTEIRKQILSILVWDAKKNPSGRIRFINYNGISAKNLQEIACKQPVADFFDDSVIIIDEIHNVVRLMQGTIDPYLLRMKGMRRLIPQEEITVDKWNPSLCAQGTKKYARGYMMYRLLLDARNSKLIGLSGTPLINFPEELGILMNVLHGYIPTIEGVFEETGTTPQKNITDLALQYKYIDFVRVSQDPAGGTRVVLTLLPHGVRKISNDIGVERIPTSEEIPSIDTIVNEIQTLFKTAGFHLRGSISLKAMPLLPPFGEEFRQKFVTMDGSKLQEKNEIVLVKRMTGLVSYYKGSRLDLMPRIKIDEVVRVPFSLFSQKSYTTIREGEIGGEKKPKGASTGFSGVWAEVYDVGSDSQTSNYKMASRQACNFVFPASITRPKAGSKKEMIEEANRGAKGGDILDTVDDDEEKVVGEEFPELEEQDEEEIHEAMADDEAAAVEADSDAVSLAVSGPAGGGGEDDGITEDVATAVVAASSESKEEEATPTVPPVKFKIKKALTATAAPAAPAVAGDTGPPAPVVAGDTGPPAPVETAVKKPFKLKSMMASKAAQFKADCKTGQKPDETYRAAIERAKECLRTIGRDNLKLGGPDGLEVYSPKFAEMLTRIAAGPGSSLVYSQFLDMEGIGIFRIAMDINGYAPIEILKTAAGPAFSKTTEDSFSKNPTQPRYITFSGGEEEDIRRLALDIFNANLDELPGNIKSVLEKAGMANNHKGEICRVICITSAGAEGISLKCVRAVHIMEPYWNDVRLKQVKGRAIRIGSHLELPEADRDVSIYTYLSTFSPEAQVAKSGEVRIDETVRLQDRLDRKDALAVGLPIPKSSPEYVLTTDERLFVIAERKKAIMNSLETVMKSAAVDCELNIKENYDKSYVCLPLEGKIGDFLYHPDLDIDIRESASMYSRAPAPVAQTLPKKNYIKKKINKVEYRLKEIRDPATKVVSGFTIYASEDTQMLVPVGTTGVKQGEEGPEPAAPVKWLAKV